MIWLNFFLFFLFFFPLSLSLFQYRAVTQYSFKKVKYLNLGGSFLVAFLSSIVLTLNYSVSWAWSVPIFFVDWLTLSWQGLIQKPTVDFLLAAVWLNFFLKALAHRDVILDEKSYLRLSLYLDIFQFSFFITLLADSFVPLFLGWELLGIISYLLLSFSYESSLSNQAAFTAFLYDKIGSSFLLLGGGILIFSYGDVSLSTVQPNWMMNNFMGPFFLVAIYSKTLQFGVNNWLMRSLEIPTVSLTIVTNFLSAAPAFILLSKLDLLNIAIFKESVFYLGVITIILAVGLSLITNVLKKFIVYVTAAQLGLIWIVVSFESYKACFPCIVVFSILQFLSFSIEKIGSFQSNEPFNLIGVQLSKKLVGVCCILMLIVAIAHTFLLESIGAMLMHKADSSDWVIQGSLNIILALLTIALWRPAFLLCRSFFKSSYRDYANGISWAENISFVGITLVLTILGMLYLWKELQLDILGKTLPWFRTSITIGISIVLSGVSVLLLKNLRKSLEHNFEWIYKIFLTQAYIESFYDFFIVRTFKFISSTLSQKIDGLVIEQQGFSGSISMLQKVYNLMAKAQNQTFSFYLLFLVFGCFVLLSIFILK